MLELHTLQKQGHLFNFYLQIIEFTVKINRMKTITLKIGVRNDKLFLSYTFLQYMKCIKMRHKKLPK